ncbi:MAG: caspase family protein [Chitinophagaceae bacterium]|nr:caspase family protein [Chitinophagaceae bacterium]MBP6589012.1 caspase family protein [Chitinophagaceae bacterium]MBP8243467.1 caspase family protein [Chitinophagaceae bacterium]
MLIRTTILPLLFFLFLIQPGADAQSVYHFRYRFNQSGDSLQYRAFLLRNDDGSGILRVRYSPGKGREDILVESAIEEYNPTGNNAEPDTSVLYIKAINPSFILTDGNEVFNKPLFIFRYRAGSGYFEPDAVMTEKSVSPEPGTEFRWEFYDRTALTRDFVSVFFNTDDEFYINMFRPLTRGLSVSEKKVKMHLLIVADTLDKKLGKAIILDVKKVMETFEGISKFLGIRFLPVIVQGKNYGKAGVQAALSKLKTVVSQDDIVIFYYSGHGFRIPEKPGKYPNLKLKNVITPRPANFRLANDSLIWVKKERDVNIGSTMNLEEIFKTIRKMGARFNLVIGDCCNDDIFSVTIEGRKPSNTKGSGIEWDEANIRSLFLNKTPLSVIATAAKEGQRAAAKNGFGSFFTEFFKKSLESHCSRIRANVSWDLVLTQAKIKTSQHLMNSCKEPKTAENGCVQNPDSNIFIGR